jgi:hypothetical protein
MVAQRGHFVSVLMDVNLPLAGRCAAQVEAEVSASASSHASAAPGERSRHSQADLRSCNAAARALGELGDPRFESKSSPHPVGASSVHAVDGWIERLTYAGCGVRRSSDR